MNWRATLSSVLIVPFILIGCADKEQMAQYYRVEEARTDAIIKSIESQSRNNSDARMMQMQSFSTAATNASLTPSPVDDALLAFAWGYQMGQPMNIEIPRLQPIVAPDKSSDLVRAWTPLIGMAVPFLYPLAYGWANNNAGTRISADNGASVLLDSGNAGSYNRAGGDMTYELIQEDYATVNSGEDVSNDCPGCDTTNPCEIDPNGFACPGCSCGSFEEGACECPGL